MIVLASITIASMSTASLSTSESRAHSRFRPEPAVERERRITSNLKSTVSGRRHVNRDVLALKSLELDSTSNATRARAQRSGARARNRTGGTVMADQIFDHEKLDVYG